MDNQELSQFTPEQVAERIKIQRSLCQYTMGVTKACKKRNVIHARANRKTPGWQAYQKSYMQAYLLNPVNKQCHRIRMQLRNWLKRSKVIQKSQPFFHVDKNAYIAKLNKVARKNGFLTWEDQNATLDHIITIRWFVEFGITDPVISCDIRNINVVSREKNSSKRSNIPDKAIALADELEKDLGLVGFTEFITQKKFELEVVAEEKRQQKVRELRLRLDRMETLGTRNAKVGGSKRKIYGDQEAN